MISKFSVLVNKHSNIKKKTPGLKCNTKRKNSSTGKDALIILDSEDETEIPKKKVKTSAPSKVLEQNISCISISDDEDIKPLIQTEANTKNVNKTNLKGKTKKKEKTEPRRKVSKRNVSDNAILDEEVISPVENKASTSNASVKKRKIKEEKVDLTDLDFLENHQLPVKIEDIKVEWLEYELLAQQKDLKLNVAKNIVNLFNDGNTIPFIARYRRDATENMTPEMLREVKESLEDIVSLKQKIGTAIKSISKTGNLNPDLEKSFQCARSLGELEIMYAPYKPESKKTLAQRAKDLGLEQPALNILHDLENVNFEKYIDKSKKDLATVVDVEKGITRIIAQIIATDSEMLSYLRELRSTVNFMLETKKLNSKSKNVETKKITQERKPDISKFENYFSYKIPVKYIKPHQVLAINRGEHHKYLSVKIVVPDFVQVKFKDFCIKKWRGRGLNEDKRQRTLVESINDAYARLVQPLIIREIRSELKTIAEKASYDVFSKNLKQLLLAAPFKGQPILAIDPGFTGGCKLALVSETGLLLAHNKIYPHQGKSKNSSDARILKDMLKEYHCSLIAVGNGTACRETEQWLSELIQQKYFSPLDVKYTIVSEDGASIYSCSPEAKKEFPDLDTNIISAVSLARRIQDPLAELVKIEPQHLGVGMYQHDLKKKTLEEALNEVVSECVSFVGVDLNTASQCILRRIAGLSDKRASQIIDYRDKYGPFLYRAQLTKVYGIGPKLYEQCAGFLRVGPTTPDEALTFYKKPKTTKLDSTIIHPESYDVAQKIMKKFKLKPEDIGEEYFINTVNNIDINIGALSSEFDIPEETVKLIVDALSKPINYDLRNEISQEPLFRKGLTSICDLKVDMVVTGQVRNVTHFGCFVDIGVGSDGLIHNSKMHRLILQIGDRVESRIENIDIGKKRIGLEALSKL